MKPKEPDLAKLKYEKAKAARKVLALSNDGRSKEATAQASRVFALDRQISMIEKHRKYDKKSK
jgi:hypothetical protein